MISIGILVPGPSEYTGNSCLIMAGNWQEFTTWSASLQNKWLCLPFILIVDNCIFFTFRRQVLLCSSPFRVASISTFIPAADTGATRINTNAPEMDY